jgi:tight adherence protein B
MTQYSGKRAGDDVGIDAVLALSQRAGVPAAELLRSEAVERRRDARARAEEQAQTLSVRLMLPLGVCVLPAFMVLGVLPLLVTVIGSTSVKW